jgi:lysophospholipase L1-like esterase
MRQAILFGTVILAGCGSWLASAGCSSSGGKGGGSSATGSQPVSDATTADAGSEGHWVGTWACAPQTTEQGNLPPAPGLNGNTLRQTVHVTLGGTRLRLRLSNEFGTNPVTMDSVHAAGYKGGGAIDTATDRALTFSGTSAVTIPVGQMIWSDPFDYTLNALSDLAISIHFTDMTGDVTGHPGSRTTSYLQSGDTVTAETMASAASTAHWYFITGLDVMAENSSAAIVVLGDSLTDGRGSTTNGNDRWPDDLARRLQANAATANIAVLNQGIGGNAVLAGGLGPTAVGRFDRDVLGQSGARWLIVYEGVNDIGNSSAAAAPTIANNLIGAYQDFVTKAHQNNFRAYGATLTPFAGNGYFTPEHESARQTVNSWIRTSNVFDGVIDFEAAVRDPADATKLLAACLFENDWLHLNPAGYRKLADAIDLSFFTP